MKPVDLKYFNDSLRLMAGRMGYNSQPAFNTSPQQGINDMAAQLQFNGGYPQQNRMIKDKRRSLDKAVLYSYQGAFVKKIYNPDTANIDSTFNPDQPPVRALINPDKLKQNYDDKIISIGFEHHFLPGDVFEWHNTNSYWLVYLQDLDELAYFRGEIRRCRNQIEWLDEEGNKHSTYAAVRGPVETKIDYIQKHGISVDNPNYSLDILMPLNDATKKQFKRYSKFYLQDDEVCWRVEAVDWISTPGILQVVAVEYYANETEDEIEKGLVGSLVVKNIDTNTPEVNNLIIGDTFIKPQRAYTYSYSGADNDGTWEILNNAPVVYKINDDNTIKLKWYVSYSGQFELKYKDFVKTIVVESLF